MFFLLKSPFNVYIPTFGDLYSNSYVWFEQNTNIWAIVGKTTILAIAVPFECGMTLKHRKGPFRARTELMKRSGERSQKVELKTWQGHILEINMSCLFVLCKRPFHGKRHWDRVELVQVLTWFRFWPWGTNDIFIGQQWVWKGGFICTIRWPHPPI